MIDRLLRRRPDPLEDAQLLERVSDAASEYAEQLLQRDEVWRTPLAELFVGLEGLPSPGPSELSTRSQNLLRRNSVTSWDRIAGLTIEQISRWRGAGTGTLKGIATSILRDWANAHRSGSLLPEEAGAARSDGVAGFGADGAHETGGAPGTPDRFEPLVEGLLDSLRWLWREQGARTLREAFELWASSAPPAGHVATVNAALDLDLGVLIGGDEPSEAAWLALLDFDDRVLTILAHRRFLDPTLTLEELGARFNVTRERIRQIEARGLEDLTRRWESDARCAPLRHLIATVRRAIGPIATIEAVAAAIGEAARASGDAESSASTLALRSGVLRALLGAREEVAGMSLTEVAASTLREQRAKIEQMETGALVSQDGFDGLTADLGAPHRFRTWIEEQLGLRKIEEGYLPWRGSLNEKAVAIMTVRNATMTMMELHEAIGFNVDPRSLRNAVHADDRIVRRGPGRYELRAWGGEEYSGIVEELQQAIERSPDQEVVLSDIIEQFVEDFGVSEGSVRSFAADWRFIKGSGGTLRLRGADDPDPTYRYQAPEDTPGLFMIDGVWHLRVIVDADLLRGSGRLVRNGVALLAGLEPGLMVGFEYEGGTVTFSWRAKQPAIGSLRGIAVTHGCVEGDRLFVPVEGPEPRRSRTARLPDIMRAPDLVRLALEVGLAAGDRADAAEPESIARALALPAGADWHDVADRLRDRGEQSLGELTPVGWR